MDGRIGIHRPDDDLQLTLDASLLFWICGDEGESTNAFAVETHILREGLGESDLVTLFNEVTDGKGILGSVSGGEALVCHVEEGEELLFLDKVRDISPLSGGGVDASGIVSAGVQKNDSTLWSVLCIGSLIVLPFTINDVTELSSPVDPLSNRQSLNRTSSCRSTCIAGPQDRSPGKWGYGCPRMA